jgi:glycosyltransferase involved in cell wall biosynthesis
MNRAEFDAIVFTDARFPGGTSFAVIADIRALSKAGLKIGLGLIESSGFFSEPIEENSDILQLTELPGVTRIELDNSSRIRCDVAFFHNPLVFDRPVRNAVRVEAKHAIIVMHQPPFSGGNKVLLYDPFGVQKNIQRQFGAHPYWAPVSGICRAQMRSYAPFIRQTERDWPNSFDVDAWVPSRPKLQSKSLVIGRHGRPHNEKWPQTGRQIELSLPADHNTAVRIMGADRSFLKDKNVDTSNWEILDFNEQPVSSFLDSLDVFCYHHSNDWVEAFGRTIAEAMLMGVRCVLSPKLEATFGPHAHYCEPEQVGAVLDHIRSNLDLEREAAKTAREYCINAYSTRNITHRYENLASDRSTIKRTPKPSVSPFIAARKLIGLRRRRWKLQKQST